MKYLKKYKVFESSDSLEDINEYIDDILLPLEETNFVMVRNYKRFLNIDPSNPDVKTDVNHIKIDISANLDNLPQDDFELTENNLSEIKSLYNYMSDIWSLKEFKVKYYYPKNDDGRDFGSTTKDIESMEYFLNWYNKDFTNGENLLIGITLIFAEK